MISIKASNIANAAKNEHSSGVCDDRERTLKQCSDEDSDIIISDDNKKQERRTKLKRARQGKKPKRSENDYIDTAKSSSDECQTHYTPQRVNGTETTESSSDEDLGIHIRPASSGNGIAESSREAERRHHVMSVYEGNVDAEVVAEVVTLDEKPFSFSEELLSQHRLSAYSGPVIRGLLREKA